MNTASSIKFSRQTFASGIDCWRVDAIVDLASFLTQLKSDYKSYLVANIGKTALSAPGLVLDPEDLFQNAPAEIRKENALHVSEIDYSAKYFSEVAAWLGKDSGLLIHSSLSATTLKQAKKLYWAWFSQPSILLHQTRAGSQELAEKLFENVESVVLLQKGSPTESSLFVLAPSSSAAKIEMILKT